MNKDKAADRATLQADRAIFDGLHWCSRCGLETSHSNGTCRECVKARKQRIALDRIAYRKRR